MNTLDASFTQLKMYSHNYQNSSGFDVLGLLSDPSKCCNLQATKNHDELRHRLLNDIEAKRPLSLIRLGDGEGNLLFWGGVNSAIYPELAQFCVIRILKIMFGSLAMNENDLKKLYLGMSESIINASYLGLPTPEQVNNVYKKINEFEGEAFGSFDIRGSAGVLSVWDWIQEHRILIFDGNITLVNWHVHTSILKFFGDLIVRAGNISIISCYPGLIDLLSERYSVIRGDFYEIPPQASNIKGTPSMRHYPDIYLKIINELTNSTLTGKLFFVGAGLVGKLYCEKIRSLGGMAIDVGSLMDVWMGESVRPYHNDKFINSNKIMTK
jgi:hypothetical protein